MKVGWTAPSPGVPEPKRRNKLHIRRLGSTVGNGYTDQNVINIALGVLGGDIEVAIFLEDAGLFDLKLWVELAAAAVLFEQAGIRKLGLRVLVETLEIGVGGRGVEVIINLFHILAVVALVP